MTEQEILKAFRASLKQGDRVRHMVDWVGGTIIGKIHPAYPTGVVFDDGPDRYPVYLYNLFPEWWPAPEWVMKKEEIRGRQP